MAANADAEMDAERSYWLWATVAYTDGPLTATRDSWGRSKETARRLCSQASRTTKVGCMVPVYSRILRKT